MESITQRIIKNSIDNLINVSKIYLVTKNRLRLITDGSLFFAFAILNTPLFTGLPWHEAIGFLFIIPLFVHLLRSWKVILQTLKSFKRPKSFRRKLNFLLSTVLFILCIIEIASGLIISRILLPLIGMNTFSDWKWRALHNQTSVGIFIIISVHIAIHWPKIVAYFANRQEMKRSLKEFISLSNMLAVLKKVMLLLFLAVLVIIVTILVIGVPGVGSINAPGDFARINQNIVSGGVQLVGAIIALVLLSSLVRQFLKLLK